MLIISQIKIIGSQMALKHHAIKKRELSLSYRNDKNNAQIKDHYKKYISVLKRVINEAKNNIFIIR
jgi:hypothetical protein